MVDFKARLAERRAKQAEELASQAPVADSGNHPYISDNDLDHIPLTFGRYKGKTPNQVAESGPKGEDYIRWMFENVKNKPTCSALLARECGWVDMSRIYKNPPPQLHDGYGRTKPSTGFDDMDDDIPF